MANPQMERITESTLFKFITPTLLALVMTFGSSQLADLKEQVKTANAYLAESKTDKATNELRFRYLENLATERGATLKSLQDKALMLEFRTQDIEQRLEPSKGHP